jgi:polysaccharide transporter, PST family
LSVTQDAIVVPRTESPVNDLPVRELDRRATSAFVWQGAKIAVHLLQYVILARLVAPAEFGKFALAAPLFLVLSAINEGGLSTATIISKQYDAQLASSLWWTQFALGLVTAVVMVAGSPLLASLFGVPDLLGVGIGLAASLVVESWGMRSRAGLRRDMRIAALAVVDIGSLLVAVTAALIASHWVHGVGLVLIVQMVNALSRTVIAVILEPVRLRRFVVTDAYRSTLRTGWHLIGSDLLNLGRVQLPVLMIGFYLVLSDVGLFSRANQLLGVPLAMLGPAMTSFLLPLLSRTREQPTEFRAHLQRTQRLFLAISIPVSIWIAMGPMELIRFVLGPQWAPVVPVLQALSPLFIAQVVAAVARNALLASEQSRTDRLFAAVNLAVAAVAVLIGARFGLLPVALALSLSGLLICTPFLVVLALRKSNLNLAIVLDGARTTLWLAAAATVLVWACEALPLPGAGREVAGLLAVGGISMMALKRMLGVQGAGIVKQ